MDEKNKIKTLGIERCESIDTQYIIKNVITVIISTIIIITTIIIKTMANQNRRRESGVR